MGDGLGCTNVHKMCITFYAIICTWKVHKVDLIYWGTPLYIYSAQERVIKTLWGDSACTRWTSKGFIFSRFCKTCLAYLNNRDQMKNKRLTLEAEIRVVPAANEPGQWIPKGKIRRPHGLIKCHHGMELTGEGLILIRHNKTPSV